MSFEKAVRPCVKQVRLKIKTAFPKTRVLEKPQELQIEQ
jgi:hypothetical protein